MKRQLLVIASVFTLVSLVAHAADNMQDAANPNAPFKFSELNGDPKLDKDMGATYAPQFKLADGKVYKAANIQVRKKLPGGILLNFGLNFAEIGYDPQQKLLTYNDKTIGHEQPANAALISELGWFFMRNSDNPKARRVLKEVYHIDLDAKAAAGESAFDLAGIGGKGKADHGGLGLRGASGTGFAGPPTREQILSYASNPDAWDGKCTGPDAPCTYTKGGESFLAEPELKKGMAMLFIPKAAVAAASTEASAQTSTVDPAKQAEFESRLLPAQTIEELRARVQALAKDKSSVTLYVGAEWCGPCRGKRSKMLSGQMEMPDLISWDPDNNRSALMGWANNHGNTKIPALFTIPLNADGSMNEDGITFTNSF